MEKYCKNCKIYKNFNLFHKHKKGKFGLYSICKECRKNENYSENVIIFEKKCKSCLINFKKENFYKNKNNKDGYQNDCKKCYLKKRSNNQSKIDNYMKKLITKFCNKNTISVSFNFNDLIKLYLLQNKKCHITGHEMTHLVDTKGRIDNIFNISILADSNKKVLSIDDIKLVINLFYSVGLKYDLDSDKVKSIYRELTCNNCDYC